MYYNGSGTNYKTRESMPCGDYNTEIADTQILFREAFQFLDQRTPAAAPGDHPVQLCEGEQQEDDGLCRDRHSPSDNL